MKPRAIILTLCALACAAASATKPEADTQLPPAGSVLTLQQCRATALQHNKTLGKTRMQIQAAQYQKKEAFAAYLPAIDFAGGYVYNQKGISILDKDQYLPVETFNLQKQAYEMGLVKNPMTGEPLQVNGQYIPEQVALLPKSALEYDLHNVFFGAVTLTQPIFMGGKIVAMNKITGYAEELARAMHDSQAQDIIYAVDAAYWQIVSLKAKERLAVSYVALLDTLSHNVGLMLEQGVATQRDRLAVDVRLNTAQVDLTRVQNGLTLSRMALAQLCGMPVDTPYTLADEDAPAALPATAPAHSYDMHDVYAHRQDLRALELGARIYSEKANVARASMMPNIALIGTYSFSNPNLFDGFKKRFNGMFSVGAMVTIPIWHWGGNYNKYRAARAQADAARFDLENARELISLQVSQAAYKATEALKTYRATQANLASADENMRCADLGFRDGIMTIDNVMEAQTAWLKAHSENIDAHIDVYLCDVYLSKTLGNLAY